MKWINNKLGTRYWYEVRFIYKSKNGARLFDFVKTVGVTQKSIILKDRRIKKVLLPVHKLNGIPRHLLDNGVFVIEVQTYLRWFKK